LKYRSFPICITCQCPACTIIFARINIFTFSQSVPFYWILPRMSYAAVIRPNFPSAITETGVAEQDVFRAGVNIIGPGVAGTDAKMDVAFLAQDHLATCEQPVAWEFQGQPGAPGGAAIEGTDQVYDAVGAPDDVDGAAGVDSDAAIDGPGRSDRQSDCDRRPRLAVVRRTKAKGTDCENVNLFAIMEI
jgi:hypothetical protein